MNNITLSLIIALPIVLLLVTLRICRAIKGWQWQKEHPKEALRNWINNM